MFKYTLFVTHLEKSFSYYTDLKELDASGMKNFLAWLEGIGVDLSLPNIHHLLKYGTCLEDSYSLAIEQTCTFLTDEEEACNCLTP